MITLARRCKTIPGEELRYILNFIFATFTLYRIDAKENLRTKERSPVESMHPLFKKGLLDTC